MMIRALTISGLLSLGAAQDAGLSGCECLAAPPTSSYVIAAGEVGAGLLRATPNGTAVVPYPTDYGTLCGSHDAPTEPFCSSADGVALAGAPDWCNSRWCWVDPANCNIASDASSYFHVDNAAAVLHYSYATCSSDNTFTNSELDAQACNEDHSEVVATHCSGVQADARCPCINWADSVDTRAPFLNSAGTALVVPLGDPAVNYEYAMGYGSGACAAHDAIHPPTCADANGAPLAGAPDWCQSNWCWVDPANCILADDAGVAVPAVASSYFHRDDETAARFYSYETCQHDNTFSNTELDPQACNDEHSEVVADHCMTNGHRNALTTCACITMPEPHPFAIAGSDPAAVTVTIGDATFSYPPGYGMAACAPHDELQAPSCANADGSAKADAADWCSANWCFVDPATCTGIDDTEPVASTYFHIDGQEATFYYSYQTCSHANSFTNSADDDQACNADHSDVATWCTPPANAVAAQLTLALDMPAADGLAAFKTTFKTDVAGTLDGVSAVDIIITGVAAGSVVVDFYVGPADDGSALVAAADVSTALAVGVTIGGATLTAESVTAAPAMSAATPDATPDVTPTPAPAPDVSGSVSPAVFVATAAAAMALHL